MLKTLKNLHGVSVLSKEAQKKIAGGVCGVVNRFEGGYRCYEPTSSKAEAIAGMNELHKNIKDQNGEGNWYSADSAGWCCASCSSLPQCNNNIYFK